MSPQGRCRADEDRQLKSLQASDDARGRILIFRRQDLDRGKEYLGAARRADAFGEGVLPRTRDHDASPRKRLGPHDRAARTASAPRDRSLSASLSPNFSGASIGPFDSARTTWLPSGLATSARRRSSVPLATA